MSWRTICAVVDDRRTLRCLAGEAAAPRRHQRLRYGPRFRTIQVWPKDLPAARRRADHAVRSWALAGAGGRTARVRHETPRLIRAPRRRGGRMAARGARAAAGDAAGRISQ